MLEIREITKDYEGHPLLRGVSFRVDQGETLCILGPSGSGKSTLLKIIAGIETPESGSVLWDGNDLKDTPVHKRNFGLMFQDYALFPHRSVEQNVAFGLRMQNLPAAEIRERVRESLEQIDMPAFAGRRVTDLSGGEQQRVALARALAPRPRLLMLDEPLGALDRNLREQLTKWLRRLLHQSGIPTIYVTHDQEEAFTIADRILLLHEGLVVQEGTPKQVYQRPVSTWVSGFLGLGNLLEGKLVNQKPFRIETDLGVFQTSCLPGNVPPLGERVSIMLPTSSAHLEETSKADNKLTGLVEDSVFHGADQRISLKCAGDIHFEFDLPDALPVGKKITLFISPADILCLS
ncbi:MAG: ABC transporter ATP-binding protein [Anaerolineaceae bacterium]|nr:ABC transporter ATP-binding protein [Anaerolineaceae bacterium]